MAQDEHKEHPKYMNIFWWLLGLTIIEVAVAIPEYALVLKAILLIGLACGKAALVAIYFMHLKFGAEDVSSYRHNTVPYLRFSRHHADA